MCGVHHFGSLAKFYAHVEVHGTFLGENQNLGAQTLGLSSAIASRERGTRQNSPVFGTKRFCGWMWLAHQRVETCASLWVKTNGIPFGVGEFTTHFRLPILVVGLVDVHWGYDLGFEKPMATWLCGGASFNPQTPAPKKLEVPDALGRPEAALQLGWRDFLQAGWGFSLVRLPFCRWVERNARPICQHVWTLRSF